VRRRRAFEVLDALAQGVADLRKLSRSEYQQYDDEQDDQLAKTQTHADCVARFRIGCP
jgi:hypothetical protein